MLFRSQDLSQIKEFCRQEWTKILQGRVSIQDFIVAKEVRLGSYSCVRQIETTLMGPVTKVFRRLEPLWPTAESSKIREMSLNTPSEYRTSSPTLKDGVSSTVLECQKRCWPTGQLRHP